jgi:hypothetical protein
MQAYCWFAADHRARDGSVAAMLSKKTEEYFMAQIEILFLNIIENA